MISTCKRFLFNLQSDLPKHRQTIRLSSYLFFMVLAFIAFVVTSVNYVSHPLYANLAAGKYFVAPILFGFLAAAIVLFFGFFFTNALLLISSKKLRFFNFEVEFDTSDFTEKKAGDTINYLSKVIETHKHALAMLREEDKRDHLAVLKAIMGSYQSQLRSAYDDNEIDVSVFPDHHKFTEEQNVLIEDLERMRNAQKVVYKNRIKSKSTNLMVAQTRIEVEYFKENGDLTLTEQTVYVIVFKQPDQRFDDLDKHTLIGLIHYSEIVKNEIEMLDLIEYN
ncbi:hypothetical protein ACE1TF_13835 [Geomicrobium sp. JSM 1781026]|uniref:hypothetical protein n=1 Tax=Geomicrobium sp. JSM 1781026 TaxID=3344580 RepID=UPI0035BF10B0